MFRSGKCVFSRTFSLTYLLYFCRDTKNQHTFQAVLHKWLQHALQLVHPVPNGWKYIKYEQSSRIYVHAFR